jgi:hypothetical protein
MLAVAVREEGAALLVASLELSVLEAMQLLP